MSLDPNKLIEDYDRENFLRWLEEFPDQVKKACELGSSFSGIKQTPQALLVGGMGGSGISGDLVAAYTRDSSSVAVHTVRNYKLSAWVDSAHLFCAVSYSGNTEETLSLYEDAAERGCDLLAVTGGGKLLKKAKKSRQPFIKIPSGQPPRASAPYLFIPLIYVLASGELTRVPSPSARKEAKSELNKITAELAPDRPDNFALALASKINGKTPVIYGSAGMTGTLGLRLKNQFNENAKMMAFANELPELNHNEIMGWEQLQENPEDYIAIFLRDTGEHERVKKRFSISREIISDSVSEVVDVRSRGESLFSRFLSLMLLTDYISYYTALFRQKDPSSIENIEALKTRL